MRISINLATRPFADLGPVLRRLRIAMAVLAFIAILLGIGTHAIQHEADLARARDHALDARIARINKERQDSLAMMRQPENAKVLAQAGRLNQLFDEKAFSWTLAMEDLETVMPGGIQVTTLEPNRAPDGVITLKLRVTGPRDRAIEMVQNLEHSRHFSAPRIVGESAEATGGPTGRVQPVSASGLVSFDVLAEYIPPFEKQGTGKNAQAAGKSSKSRGSTAQPSSTAESSDASAPVDTGKMHTPYLEMPRPKAPAQTYKGVAQ